MLVMMSIVMNINLFQGDRGDRGSRGLPGSSGAVGPPGAKVGGSMTTLEHMKSGFCTGNVGVNGKVFMLSGLEC